MHLSYRTEGEKICRKTDSLNPPSLPQKNRIKIEGRTEVLCKLGKMCYQLSMILPLLEETAQQKWQERGTTRNLRILC